MYSKSKAFAKKGENHHKNMSEKKKKASEKVNYKRYPLWDNIRVAHAGLVKDRGGECLAVLGGDVCMSVLQPFAAMALPSAVVYLLGSDLQPGLIFLCLAGYVVLLQAMGITKQYLSGVYRKIRFLYRCELGTEFFEAALSADFQEFESTKGQEKAEGARRNVYCGNDVGIEAFLGEFENTVIAMGGLMVYSVILGRLNFWLLLLLFGVNVGIMAVNVWADRRTVKYDEEYIKMNRSYEYLKREVLVPANGKDIRLYRCWGWFRKEFQQMTEALAYWSGRERNCSINASIFGTVVNGARDLAVYAYLIWQMAQGRIDLAAFLLYAGIVASFGSWMDSLTQALTGMVHNNRYMDRYRDFLEFAHQDTNASEAVSNPGKRHEIRLEHVHFRYEGCEEDAISDLSMTLKPGEKIALVGMNGAGKSTLIKLICGLYHPSSGKIYLDGQDVSHLSPEEYRKEFAVVFQEVFAFSFPLADNVSCRAKEDTDHEKLERILRDAELWDRVQAFPEKEESSLNKDIDPSGISLSGGELQRLMLARALYKDSPVVILDEPTAALDPIAESQMYDKYYEMTRDKTGIFISHRLSSTKFCDRILYMEKGRITEEGGHLELMEKQGAYAAMFHTQAQYYEQEGAFGAHAE